MITGSSTSAVSVYGHRCAHLLPHNHTLYALILIHSHSAKPCLVQQLEGEFVSFVIRNDGHNLNSYDIEANASRRFVCFSMDDLDKQLAQLQLINSAELPPNPGTLHGKKIGPAVPPKPKKPQQPLVSNSLYCA